MAIHDDHGHFVARVDFLLHRDRVVIEFDRAVKYAGADGREALMRESAARTPYGHWDFGSSG